MAHTRRLRRKKWQSDMALSSVSNPSRLSASPTATVQEAAMGDLTHPQALSSNQMLHLQRAIGNAEVRRLLASNGQAARSSDRTSIQRYPATVFDVPLKKNKWKTHTESARRAKEGKSGGVVFYRSKPKKGPVETVVVKPENTGLEEGGKQGQFAETKLQEAGFAVPKSRRVDANQTEGQEIVSVMQKFGVPFMLHGYDAGYSQITHLQIMGAVAGESLSNFLSEEVDPGQEGGKVDKAMELLTNSNFKGQVAKLIATDILLGNDDRISHYAMNFGNLMINGTNVVPIDSDSDLTPNFSIRGRNEALQKLAQRPEEIADNFLNGVDAHLRMASDATAELFRKHQMYQPLRNALIRALKDASYVVAARSNKIATGEHAELIKQRQEQLRAFLGS